MKYFFMLSVIKTTFIYHHKFDPYLWMFRY